MKDRKVSIFVASAIAGCFYRESQVNPGIWESLIEPSDGFFHDYQYDGIGGYGFGQFTNVGGSWRCRDYYLWCVENNKEPDDGTAQLEYIVDVEKVWYSTSRRIPANTLDEFLASDSTNLEDLVWDWLANWEGVEGNAFSIRYEFAVKAESYIRAHESDDKSGYQWVTGNRYITEEESLRNSLMLYWTLGGYLSSKKKRKMPLYMMLKPIRL